MERDYDNRSRKSFTLMRMIYNLTMAVLILAMAFVMLWGEKLHSDFIDNIVTQLDPVIRYLFGSLCLLYGGFRLYRGLKREY